MWYCTLCLSSALRKKPEDPHPLTSKILRSPTCTQQRNRCAGKQRSLLGSNAHGLNQLGQLGCLSHMQKTMGRGCC